MTFGRRLFLLSLVVSLCLTAALAIGTLLFGDFDENGGNLVATTAFLSLASLLALPAGVLLDHGRAPLLAWTVIVAAAAAFVLAELALWSVDENRPGSSRSSSARRARRRAGRRDDLAALAGRRAGRHLALLDRASPSPSALGR